MPRNDAADRYSPETAAALKRGGDPAGGDEEVRRRAHRGHPAGADEQGDQHARARPRGRSRRLAVVSLGLGALRPAQLPPRPARPARGHGSTATASHESGTPRSRTSSSAGASCSSSGRPTRNAPPASRAVTARRSWTGRGSLGPRELRRGQPGRAGGRPAAAAERDAGLRAGHGDAPRRRRPRRRRRFPRVGTFAPSRFRPAGTPLGCGADSRGVLRSPRPESNSPRVAASSSSSRSSRACRRLTGTSPTSVCASSPPLTSLRSSCTACTASR